MMAKNDGLEEAMKQMTLQSERATSLAEGVTYKEQLYRNKEGKPLWVYTAVLQPHSDAEVMVHLEPRGTAKPVLEQVKESERRVLAATNGGFFRYFGPNGEPGGGDLTPYGARVIAGKIYGEPSPLNCHADTWFGVTKEGKYIISDTKGYEKDYRGNLSYAIGGHKRLVTAGVFDISTEADDTAEPRTTVGYSRDGALILLAVDGRSERSVGATYSELALLYAKLDLGVVEALNLDGGGSTTVVVEEKAGFPQIRNCPSDVPPRVVSDSIMIVKKT